MELRKLRMAAGLSQAEVARAVGMSESKVGRQETAKIGIYLRDLHDLLDLYQVSEQRRAEIVAWSQVVEATLVLTSSSSSFSVGVLNPSVLRGRLFRRVATASSSA